MIAVEPAPESRDLVPVVADPGAPDQNPALVYLAGKPSAVGRRGLQRSLDRAAGILSGGLATSALVVDWARVRYQHVAALRAVLLDDGAKPNTINHVLAAVRGTVKEAWRLGLIDAETKERVMDVSNVKASTLPAGRHVDAGEVAALFRACRSDTPVGARDAAMLALLYGCGLRRSEAVAVQLDDYDDGCVTIRSGKGRKDRVVFCPGGGREAIDAWIARRGSWPGALLSPVAKGGKVQQRAMTDQAVPLRLRFLSRRANVREFSPHDLRRSFVGELLDAGADISAVQGLAGHANTSTTQLYDRRGDRAKEKAAGMLLVPYVASTLPRLGKGKAPPAPATDAAPAPEPTAKPDDAPG